MAQVICTLDSVDTSLATNARETFAKDVAAGLTAQHKYIPAIYHYDAEGSHLFNRITELPEYYLTRCELESLKINGSRIADLLHDSPANLIEFGPGDGHKTRTLIRCFLERNINFRYSAIDISRSALEHLADDYQDRFPQLEVACLVAGYFEGLHWLNNRYRQRNLVLFLGSNIGNLDATQIRTFLRSLRQGLNDKDMVMIGFDLDKDAELIRKAYNDSEDITAEFNLNVLRRINRELKGDFDISKFRYEGIYEREGRVLKSYLVSLENQVVTIGVLDNAFRFSKGELIHTEDSRKYRETDIEEMAVSHGFSVLENLYDPRRYFVDSAWEVRKSRS